MKSLIVHIGAHKTGSTAIQKTLFENRNELASAAIHYPEVGFSYYGHHLLQTALKLRNEDDVGTMAEALNALDGEVVLSSENFSRSDSVAIKALADALKPEKVRVIYYQRNFIDMIYVWWQERVKHGSVQTFLSYYSECLSRPFTKHILTPPVLLDRWAQAFGREAIEVYLYDEIPNAAEHFLLTVLGLENKQVGRETLRVNKSLDASSTEFVRCLNLCGLNGLRALLNNDEAKSLRNRLKAESAEKLETFEIDYSNNLLSQIEKRLKNKWGNRIVNAPAGEGLFVKRTRKVEMIDSSFWFGADQLAAEIRQFAAKLKED